MNTGQCRNKSQKWDRRREPTPEKLSTSLPLCTIDVHTHTFDKKLKKILGREDNIQKTDEKETSGILEIFWVSSH